MSCAFVGIDIGLEGAIAAIDEHRNVLCLHDTPLIKAKRHDYDVAGMYALLTDLHRQHPHMLAVIEEAQAMPGMGQSSRLSLGKGFGFWVGMLVGKVPYVTVRPGTWKKELALPADKELVRKKASAFFPGAALTRKKDHNRAEALFLAHYAGIYARGHRLEKIA